MPSTSCRGRTGTTQPRMVRQEGPIRTTVILPGEWDEWLVAEHARLDREGDELLIRAYGEQACRGERHPVLAGGHRASSGAHIAAGVGQRELAPRGRGAVTERPIEYATAGGNREAIRSLAAAWNLTEGRAGELLSDSAEYGAELRSRQVVTGPQARRETVTAIPVPVTLGGQLEAEN